MAVKRKQKGVVPPKEVGPLEAKEEKPSKHADEKFCTGALGRDLADANDEVEEALKKAGFKTTRKPISHQPFTSDVNRRRFLAGFVEVEAHRTIVMPGPDFVSTFGSRAEQRKPMDEETKAYLKEKGAAKRMLRPKRPANGVTIQQLCEELKIKPQDARKALRKTKVQKPDCGWVWALREDADAVLKQAGLIGDKSATPKKLVKPKPMTKTEKAQVVKEIDAGIKAMTETMIKGQAKSKKRAKGGK